MRRRARSANNSIEFTQTQLGHIPLIALRHAVVVGQVLNFRHAANVLGVTQSSVSTRIKALEETLGILLFERRHRGVRLTEAGQRFLIEVSAGINHLEYAVQTAGAVSRCNEGRLDMGMHGSIAAGFFAELRSRFRSIYPKIQQTIMEGRSSESIALVRDGKLDVAFVSGAVEAPDCHCREVWRENLVIALPVDHALSKVPAVMWADLAAELFIVRDGGSGPQVFEHIVRRIAERERSPNIHRFDIGRDTLMHMVAAGDGITLTHEATTHISFPGVIFRQIADETEQARFSAVWAPHNRSPALINLLDIANRMSRSARGG